MRTRFCILILFGLFVTASTNVYGGEHYSDSLQKAITLSKKPTDKIDMQLALAQYLINIEDSANAIHNIIQSLQQEINEKGTPLQHAKLQELIGRGFGSDFKNGDKYLQDLYQGLQYLKDAPSSSKETLKTKGEILLAIANAHGNVNRLDSMTYYAIAAEPLNNKYGTTLTRAYTSLILSQVYVESNDLKKAFRQTVVTHSLFKALRDSSIYIRVLPEILYCYYKSNQPDSVLYYSKQGLHLAKKYNVPRVSARIYRQMGFVFYDKRYRPRYLVATDSSVYFARIAKDTFYLAGAYQQQANALLENHRYNEAIKSATHALALDRIIHYLEGTREAYRVLMNTYKEKEDFRTAYDYQNKYYAVADSITTLYHVQEAEKMEAQYESEKKDNDIHRLENEKLISSHQQQFLLLIFFISLSVAGSIAGLFWYRQRKRTLEKRILEKELLAEHNRTNELLAVQEVKIVQAQLGATEHERKRLSFMLHDDVAGSLSGIMHHTDYVKTLDKEPSRQNALNELHKRIELLYKQIRNYSHNLYPKDSISTDPTFVKDVDTFSRYLFKDSSIELLLTLDNPGDMEKLNDAKRMVIYRVLQEASTNILKHAKASQVNVETFTEDGKFYIRVMDNGTGYNTKSKNEGIGHRNLKEQLTALGGDLIIHSHIGKGTIVEALLPI